MFLIDSRHLKLKSQHNFVDLAGLQNKSYCWTNIQVPQGILLTREDSFSIVGLIVTTVAVHQPCMR